MASTRSTLRFASLFGLAAVATAVGTGVSGTASNVPKVSWFSYKSCWTDHANARSLSGAESSSDDMTVQSCAAFCKQFRYFGVHSNDCYCGNELAGQSAPEEQCNAVCAGNGGQLCGGNGRLSVYDRTCIIRPTTLSTSTTASETSASETTMPTTVSTTSQTSSTEMTTSSTEATSSTVSSEPTSSTTSTALDSSTSSSESITSSTVESTSTSSTDATSSTSAPETSTTTLSSESQSTTDTTSTVDPTSETSVPSITTTSSSTSELPSSTSFTWTSTTEESTTTTSTTQCALATVLASSPSPCWAGVPSACTSLVRTPSIPWPAITPAATACRNGFVAGTTTAPAVASCFTNINSPQFNGASAYACVTNAPVYCQFTTVCADTVPAPTNAVSNAGFEAGDLSGWTTWSNTSPDSVISASVSAENPHSGSYSLKVVFTNTNGGSRGWVQDIGNFQPGATYVASWWWYSTNSAANTVSRMQFVDSGVNLFLHDESTTGKPTGVWTYATQTFTPKASQDRMYFSVYGNMGNGANTFYVDDVQIIKVS